MAMCELKKGKYLGYDYSHIKLKDAIKAFEKVSFSLICCRLANYQSKSRAVKGRLTLAGPVALRLVRLSGSGCSNG